MVLSISAIFSKRILSKQTTESWARNSQNISRKHPRKHLENTKKHPENTQKQPRGTTKKDETPNLPCKSLQVAEGFFASFITQKKKRTARTHPLTQLKLRVATKKNDANLRNHFLLQSKWVRVSRLYSARSLEHIFWGEKTLLETNSEFTFGPLLHRQYV